MNRAVDSHVFDRIIPREGTASVKWDGRQGRFGRADLLPLWVADMDFAAPEAVTRALAERAAHPVYGYTRYPDSLFEALAGWLRARHGWEIEREWVLWTPGVVPTLHAAALAFAQPGQGVIIQPPVYGPFATAVSATGRRVVENPLRLADGRYRMDFDDLERCAAAGARLLFLCSPHNPVGRVWRAAELENLLAIARRHRLVIVADEIHHDLVYAGQRHHLLATLTDAPGDILTAVGPSKTFNVAGLHLSALIVSDPARRAALRESFGLLHVSPGNPFSIAGFTAAYRDGGPWLEALLGYLRETRDMALDFVAGQLPGITAVPPEGTYLLWLDCRGLGLDDAALVDFFIRRAGVGLNAGNEFGSGGSGFMRLNLAAPRARIVAALERIKAALGAPDASSAA